MGGSLCLISGSRAGGRTYTGHMGPNNEPEHERYEGGNKDCRRFCCFLWFFPSFCFISEFAFITGCLCCAVQMTWTRNVQFSKYVTEVQRSGKKMLKNSLENSGLKKNKTNCAAAEKPCSKVDYISSGQQQRTFVFSFFGRHEAGWFLKNTSSIKNLVLTNCKMFIFLSF